MKLKRCLQCSFETWEDLIYCLRCSSVLEFDKVKSNSRGQVTIYTKQYKNYEDYKNGIENKGQVNIFGIVGLVYLVSIVVVLLVMF